MSYFQQAARNKDVYVHMCLYEEAVGVSTKEERCNKANLGHVFIGN